MSEEVNDLTEEAPAIDPPGTTNPEQAANLEAPAADSGGAIDPPGTT